MPQDRRKVAFSAKQKKLQLQQKRARKHSGGEEDPQVAPGHRAGCSNNTVEVLNKQPVPASSRHDPNRYRLVFKKETAEDRKQRIEEAKKAFEVVPEEQLEVSYEEVFAPGTEMDMPRRPPWDSTMTKHVLESREEKYFREYISNLEARFKDSLSHFDMNLETWRQLWRVLEFSDIVLLVTDIRYPVFHFSPALYDYVVKDMKKDMIVVFNKIDLVPPHVIIAWKEYFSNHFPKMKVMYFASYAGMKLKEGSRGRRIGKLHMAVEGSRYLLKLCQEIVDDKVDLSSWHKKIEEEALDLGLNVDDDDYEIIDEEDKVKRVRKGPNESKQLTYSDTSFYQGSRFKDGVLTIGFVGHPNVGKSSFLNAVMGKKVVSVSRTPGHTKHYQTILLTPTVRLCDCPGLVFPSLVPKPMQVLMGCYPIAQLREPYSAVSFLCQRVPVHKILKLTHPNFDPKHPSEEFEWSAFDICEAWARKRGFYAAKSARADVYRAANNILRMALDGRTICLCFYPPGFVKNKDSWINHPDIEKVKTIQARSPSDPSELTELVEQGVIGEEVPLQKPDEANSSDAGNSDDKEDSSNDSDDNECVPSAANKFDILADLS